jgi:cysteine synthase
MPRKWRAAAQPKEGMLVGISSGATLAAIAQKLKDLPAGARAGLQLRYRRTLSFGAGFPARVMILREGQCASDRSV